MKRDELGQLVERLRAGDGSAFDRIYALTNRAVYFAILYIVHDKMYAEDLLQETYIRALRALDGYHAGTNFPAWLTTIGKNLAFNHRKRAAREISTDFDAEPWKYGVRETELPYLFDLAAKILREDEYEIVMLCQVAGYKRREVSAMLGLPVGTVTWKNNEALKKLKRHLQKEGGA